MHRPPLCRHATFRVAAAFLLFALPATVTIAADQSPHDHQRVDYYLDESGAEQPVKSPQDWQRRRQAILAGAQEAMGPLPSRENLPELDVKVVEELEGEGFLRRTITFVAERGDRVTADLYLPTSLKDGETRPAMLALHPTGPLGKRIVAGDGPRPNRQYALELAQRGYVVIAPDYPSFGDAKDYDFANDRYESGTMKGIWNHMRCVDLLESLPQVDSDRIGVIGHSLGGHNAIFAAVFDPRLKVIVSSCGWTPFHDYYGGKIAGWTSDRYMPSLRDEYDLDPDRVPFDFYELVAALAPRPFFSNSPVDDGNFDVEGVQKAIPEAKKIYSLFDAEQNLQVRYPPCGHDFPTEIREQAYQFVDAALKHEPEETLDFAAELPRIPPRDPEAGRKSIATQPGYRVELVASEPVVTDPVAMCFDPDGRLYVVEMRDYSEQDQERLGRIRLLEDADGDGRFEKATVFADDLSWPTAIVDWDGGVFVGAPPVMLYLKDTDGDGEADVNRVVFEGFGRSNVQGLMNSLRWGFDNRIHGATSSSGGQVQRPDVPDMQPIDLRGRDFSFDPKKLDLRPESGGAQHGMCFDDWGRKFCCSNSDHLQVVMYEDRYAARHPYLKAPRARVSIAADGGQAPVFRRSPVEPWRIVRTRLRVAGTVRGPVEGGGTPAGYFTGATGVTIYRGDAMPEDRGRAIIGDVGSNLVHRKRIESDGLVPVGRRIDEESEFLASDDIWFRPVQFANAPDGSLHVLDMSREVIEHPKSLPPMIKQHLDLTSGRDQGRLYRAVTDDYEYRETPKLTTFSSTDLVPLLAHPNAWHRETASQLLYERGDTSVVGALDELVRESGEPRGRLHALCVLDGLDALNADLVAHALNDEHPRVRQHAIRLSEAFTDSALVRQPLESLVNDDDVRVRFQLAFTIGEFPTSWRVPLAATLLQRDGSNEWSRFAVFSSLVTGAGETAAKLVVDSDFAKSNVASGVLGELAELIGRQAREDDVAHVLQAVAGDGVPTELRNDLVKRLGLGLAASNSPVAKRLSEGEGVSALLGELVSKARTTAVEDEAVTEERVSAVRTLSLGGNDADVSLLLELLDNREPASVQFAALETLASIGSDDTGERLIERWSTLGPQLRKEALEVVLSREAWRDAFLTAVEQQAFPRAEWDPARLSLLKTTADPETRKRVEAILASTTGGERAKVVEEYEAALRMEGDVERGRAVFKKTCAACHRVEGEGHEIGPNLATVRNRGPEAVLVNVFDPNREVNPEFLNYVVVTEDGRQHVGMIAGQSATSITLKRAENKEESILRRDVELMKSSGLSLMPEGLEKDITVQQMADLLAYLETVR